MIDAYLDVETSGLTWTEAEITVVGVYLVDRDRQSLVQLVGRDVTYDNMCRALSGVRSIFTYNGTRFDLPFIRVSLGLDLASRYEHYDLMHECRRCNLYGGFNAVERQLGISRRLKHFDGWDAVVLWRSYRDHGDRIALDLLLQNNKEDVIDLSVLRERLRVA